MLSCALCSKIEIQWASSFWAYKREFGPSMTSIAFIICKTDDVVSYPFPLFAMQTFHTNIQNLTSIISDQRCHAIQKSKSSFLPCNITRYFQSRSTCIAVLLRSIVFFFCSSMLEKFFSNCFYTSVHMLYNNVIGTLMEETWDIY